MNIRCNIILLCFYSICEHNENEAEREGKRKRERERRRRKISRRTRRRRSKRCFFASCNKSNKAEKAIFSFISPRLSNSSTQKQLFVFFFCSGYCHWRIDQCMSRRQQQKMSFASESDKQNVVVNNHLESLERHADDRLNVDFLNQ